MIATVRTGSVIIASLLLATWAAATEIPYLPHHAANTCRQQYDDECTTVCLLCHQSPSELPLALPDTQGAGDMAICGQCHDDHVVVYAGNRYLFKHLGAGNHPSNVRYEESRSGYVEDPQGVKIFCDADRTRCTVQCSSCHDPHETVRDLLRVNNNNSRLCLACHRK